MKILFSKKIDPRSITVSPRPLWKCRSCPEYSIRPSCPPAVPDWQECREWVKCYNQAFLIKFQLESTESFDEEKRSILRYLLDYEKKHFRENMFVYALFPGSCNLCETCACVKGKGCTDPIHVRPSVDALGIEITSMTDIDFEEKVLYGMVFIN